MRLFVLGLVWCAACAGPVGAWKTLEPTAVPDDGEAFVLIGGDAFHVDHVEETENGRFRAHIKRAWLLPTVGAAAIADTSTTSSPEDFARHAGWQELHVQHANLDVPIGAVRSARAIVEFEPEPVSNESDHALLLATMLTVLDVVDYVITN